MYTVRLKQPLIITFSVIVICMFSLCAYHYLYVNAVRDKVRQAARKHELLWKMKDLQYVDEVLTNSVANSILTSDLSRLDAYEAAYRNFTALLNDINHLQAENEIPNIFNGNDSMTEFIRSTECSVADLMRCGERDSALMVFKSPDYRQAKDTFRQQIKDCRNHYADGKESSSRKKKTVYRAFERQDLIFLLFVVLIAFLLLILARYLAKAFVQLRHAGTVAAEHNTEINRIKNELADVNSAYQLGNNALKKQTEALAKKDEALKEQGVALVNAQKELCSNRNDLQQKNKEIEKSEERFSYLSSLTSEGIIIHHNGIVMDVNKSFCNLFGYPKTYLIGKNIIELAAESTVKEKIYQHLGLIEPVPFETVARTADGDAIPISVNSKNTIYNGAPARVTAVKDISERVKAELLLKESEERLRLAMKGTNDGLWDWNLITDEIYYSLNWKTMLGYRDEELANTVSTWKALLHPSDLELAIKQIEKLISGEEDIFCLEFRMRHKTGKFLHILSRAYIMRNENGETARIIGTHQDLSQRYEAEECLRRQVDENLSLFEEYRAISEELHSKNDDLLVIEDELRANNKELHDKNKRLADSEERFKSLFEKSKSVMMILDSDTGKILGANNSACLFYGYTIDELLNRYIYDINTLPNSEVEREFRRAKEEERSHFAFRHKLKSGEVRDVDVYTSVINYCNKHDLYSIVIDRTETVKANNEIAKVNRRLHGLESIVRYKAKSINDLLDFTLKEIIEYTNSDLGLFYHFDREKGLFLLNNWSESALLSFESEGMGQYDNSDCLNKAVTQKKTIIINDNHAVYPFMTAKVNYKSVTIPVVINNEVEAVVWIGSETTDYTLFDTQQVSFLLATTWILLEKQKMQDLLKSKLHIS